MNISEEIESSIDIVDLVSSYTKMQKAWTNYKALCPFPWHNEKTPSFIVSPSKQLAYCFGCHKWWWVIKFVMDIENCTYREAIEILANKAWIKLKSYDKKQEEINKNIYSIYKDTSSYYQESFKSFPDVKSYIDKRWLSSESIQKFNLGFSDNSLELYNYLKSKWYDDNIIKESQIFLDIKNKRDKFLNRLIFPIQNSRWDIVAFAGRILGKWEPKYLNSPATKIYDKSSILYGLFQARNHISKKDFVIVTEWYMDVISLHQWWFENTVCVSGTALTEKHISMIKRLTKKIYLCFDSDSAWNKATILSLELLKNKDIEVKIINLEWWKDPDDIIKSGQDFSEYIKNALSPIWFYIKTQKEKYDLNSINDKKKFLKELLSLLKNYSDSIEKDFYIKEISKTLDIPSDLIYREYEKTKLNKVENIKASKNASFDLKDIIIWHIISDKNLVENIKKEILFYDYIDSDLKIFFENWLKSLENMDLDKKERYKAAAVKSELSEESFNNDKRNIEIEKLVKSYNLDIYNKKLKELKEKINSSPDDMKNIIDYNNFIKYAKKLGFKK